jgi:5-hydroxyisourate hydrolase-like protein (transthyretin family)
MRLIAVLSCLATMFAGPGRLSTAQPLQATGEISGRLIDASTGMAIANVPLALRSREVVIPIGDVRSDANGRYRMSGLAAGEYFVQAAPANLVFSARYFGNAEYFSNAAPVVVRTGATTAQIDIALPPSSGALALPLFFQQPYLGRLSVDIRSCDTRRFDTSFVTDGSPAITLTNLTAGVYRVSVAEQQPSSEQLRLLRTPIVFTATVAQGMTTTVAPLQLRLGASMLFSPTFSPMNTIYPAHTVWQMASGIAIPFAGTDVAMLGGFPSGSYIVQSVGNADFAGVFSGGAIRRSAAIPVNLTAPEVLTVTLPLSPGVKIHGSIRDALSNAGVFATVYAVDDEGTPVAWTQSMLPGGYYTLTVHQGQPYRLSINTPSRYFIEYGPGYLSSEYPVSYVGPSMVMTNATVFTPSTALTEIPVTLAPSQRLVARVLDAATNQPVDGVEVRLFDRFGNDLTSEYHPITTRFGRWISLPLISGSYRLKFTRYRENEFTCERTPLETWYSGGAQTLAAAQPIALTGSGDVTYTAAFGMAPMPTPTREPPAAPTSTPTLHAPSRTWLPLLRR